MRIAWMLPPCVALAVVLSAGNVAGGASGSASPTGTTTPTPGTNLPRKLAKKEPSTLEKVGAGTKKFFSNIGDALSPGKKTTTKKAVNPYTAAKKNAKNKSQPEKKSWLSQMFSSKQTTASKSTTN